jgi:uncharacterized protein
MSVSLKKPVDPERLAANGGWLEDAMPLARMARLSSMLAEPPPDEASADCRLRFSKDENGRLRLEGEVEALLSLTCQRCLEPAKLLVSGHFAMAVVENESEAALLPAELDPVFRERRLLDLVALMEEELILAMPQVARHASVSECGPIGSDERLIAAEEVSAVDSEAQPTQRPFQVLAGLKKGQNRKK